MDDIADRIEALLANTPQSEIEQFEVCRVLRDANMEIGRLRSRVRFCDGVIRSGDVSALTLDESSVLERLIESASQNGDVDALSPLRGLVARLGLK